MPDLEIDALPIVAPTDDALLWGQKPASQGGDAQRVAVAELALRTQLTSATDAIVVLESRIAALENSPSPDLQAATINGFVATINGATATINP